MPRTDGAGLGARVRSLREERGWSQEKLAWKAKLTKNTVARVEAGQDPRLDTVRKLAKAYGMSPEELMAPPEKAAV